MEPCLTWFCAKTQSKREHIAAAALRQNPEVEVFLPRIRFKKNTSRGPAWFTEALFPNYLFARFDFDISLRYVHHARGVRGVVHFNDQWPSVPDCVIDGLRGLVEQDDLFIIPDRFESGDSVEIAGGAFHGLYAVVTRALPGRTRIAILLDFLGRQTTAEIPPERLIRREDPRRVACLDTPSFAPH
jgi:transcriptional antiterminator RfaH